MEYEIVTLKERTVIGLGTHTSNDAPDMMQKIAKVWQDFFGNGGFDGIPGKKTDEVHCYGLYTDYTWDDNGYTVLAGCESNMPVPEGYQAVVIPAGKYAKFHFHGDVRKDTGGYWTAVWNTQLPRAYRVDFEAYPPCQDESDADIDIYVGLADVCQCCGMPMTKPEEYGTEADGSPSTDYCTYCYQNGTFQCNGTMEQVIEICLDAAPEIYTDRDKSRQMMLEYFPTLKRWKK